MELEKVNVLKLKVAFFSESVIRFFKSPNLKKKYSKKTILSLKFKFQVQDIFLEIWRFEKHIALSEKKATFKRYC